MTLSRRHFIAVGASAASIVTTPAASADACRQNLAPFESINPPPEYIPGAPMRTSLLEDRGEGQRIRIHGTAVTTKCYPLPGARLEFWHTDARGHYDMAGFRFRGAQHTDTDGKFELETMMPGPYSGPRHIHFLLALRIADQPQPVMLSGGIFFPTAAEFSARPTWRRPPEFLDPASLQTVGGVLSVPCDIVVEVT